MQKIMNETKWYKKQNIIHYVISLPYATSYHTKMSTLQAIKSNQNSHTTDFLAHQIGITAVFTHVI